MKNRKFIILIVFFAVVIAAVILAFATKPANTPTGAETNEYKTEVVIGHALNDEKSEPTGGSAGDQTGKEVYTLKLYNSEWTAVIRPKSEEKANVIARAMLDACENDNIGYDRYERTTLYNLAKKADWDISAVDKKCETDCSALVSVCVNAAGIELDKDVYTGNLQKKLMDTGEFELITDKAVIDNKLLKRGDILLKKGHTVIVVDVKNN